MQLIFSLGYPFKIVSGGGFRDAAAEGRDEAEGAPGQLAQVHGHLPQAAHLLLALRRLHLVRYGEGHNLPSILYTFIRHRVLMFLVYNVALRFFRLFEHFRTGCFAD